MNVATITNTAAVTAGSIVSGAAVTGAAVTGSADAAALLSEVESIHRLLFCILILVIYQIFSSHVGRWFRF